MKSVTTSQFRKCLDKLPKIIQAKDRKSYLLWLDDPNYPSLHFKQIHSTEPIYSVRISLAYRDLGIIKNDTMIWFWIGSHEEFNSIVN